MYLNISHAWFLKLPIICKQTILVCLIVTTPHASFRHDCDAAEELPDQPSSWCAVRHEVPSDILTGAVLAAPAQTCAASECQWCLGEARFNQAQRVVGLTESILCWISLA